MDDETWLNSMAHVAVILQEEKKASKSEGK
jgi:hypothetical protein